MSFGLTNAPAAFMDLMNNVFGNYLCSIVIVFIDVIFVYSKSEDEHIEQSGLILQVLKEHKLFSKHIKCDFLFRSIAFLGNILSSECIRVDTEKMEEGKNCPRTLTPIDIQSILGLTCIIEDLVMGFDLSLLH